MEWIKNIVNGLFETYATKDIYELIDCLNITLIRKNMLKNIKGNFYRNEFGDEFIFINNELNDFEEKYVLAHELGHAIIHTDLCVSFYTFNNLQVKSKYEIQADKFAAELLLPDKLNIYEIENMNIEQLSSYLGVPTELIEYKYSRKQ